MKFRLKIFGEEQTNIETESKQFEFRLHFELGSIL